MFTLKKSLLFLFFIGIVSSSPYRGKRENGEEEAIEDIKRQLFLQGSPQC
uniref:Antixoidant peptide n=1 Tax=Odorrana andersonii TaxID=369514 RepID=K7WHP2_ODOAN|nr:antixoidant peptide precursor [Odorrana andersonii]